MSPQPRDLLVLRFKDIVLRVREAEGGFLLMKEGVKPGPDTKDLNYKEFVLDEIFDNPYDAILRSYRLFRYREVITCNVPQLFQPTPSSTPTILPS